ncbi:hypothetical protein COUCH_34535 [Couchioplanes caeruleus]|uniref:hypothetical protein n=1 Tax=Couchioplanes caeruleus TaxID=56438 RepID=UPI0020C09FE9|nr:hypothetical protein [Couchioplanes caeruleus]UQU64038.1 hypothetical protein COUCH_34535 [Couchioplanes caeruleus]
MTDGQATGGAVVASSTVSRKVLYTAASGVLTFLVTNALKQPILTSVTLSILIGGIALIVRFLADFERRLARVEAVAYTGQEQMQRLVAEAFSKIDDATEMFALIEASKLPPGLVERLIRQSAKIPQSPPIVYNFVQGELREMADNVQQLVERGSISYSGEDRDWLLGLTASAITSIDAVSLAVVDRGLWSSEMGQRYMEAQQGAVVRNVSIRRIFVHEANPEDPGAGDIESACAEQRSAGIDVRVLKSVPPQLQADMAGFIVFDGVISYQLTPAAATKETDRPVVLETQIVLREHQVHKRAQLFEKLWKAAEESS